MEDVSSSTDSQDAFNRLFSIYPKLVDAIANNQGSRVLSRLAKLRSAYMTIRKDTNWKITDLAANQLDDTTPYVWDTDPLQQEWIDTRGEKYDLRDPRETVPDSWYTRFRNYKLASNYNRQQLVYPIVNVESSGIHMLPILEWRLKSMKQFKVLQYLPHGARKRWLLERQSTRFDFQVKNTLDYHGLRGLEKWESAVKHEPEETREILLILARCEYIYMSIYMHYFGKLDPREYFCIDNREINYLCMSFFPNNFKIPPPEELLTAQSMVLRKKLSIFTGVYNCVSRGVDTRPLTFFLAPDFFADPDIQLKLREFIREHLESVYILSPVKFTHLDRFLDYYPAANTESLQTWRDKLIAARFMLGVSIRSYFSVLENRDNPVTMEITKDDLSHLLSVLNLPAEVSTDEPAEVSTDEPQE